MLLNLKTKLGNTNLSLLPLTHTAHAIRAASFGTIPEISAYLILAGIGGAAFVYAILTISKGRDYPQDRFPR